MAPFRLLWGFLNNHLAILDIQQCNDHVAIPVWLLLLGCGVDCLVLDPELAMLLLLVAVDVLLVFV